MLRAGNPSRQGQCSLTSAGPEIDTSVVVLSALHYIVAMLTVTETLHGNTFLISSLKRISQNQRCVVTYDKMTLKNEIHKKMIDKLFNRPFRVCNSTCN